MGNFTESLEPRVFTLNEANSVVPRLNETFSRIFCLNGRITSVSKDMQDLMGIWGEQVLEQDNPDNKFYFEKMKSHEEAVQELQEAVSELNKCGCVIKDMNEGLVDFYCRKGEELVLLCWKYGEPKIMYWHTMQGSFAGRRPVEELVHLIHVSKK